MNERNHMYRANRRWACPGLYRMPVSADGGICRIKLNLGRILPEQMHQLADLAEKFGNGIIEATTRANLQLRGVSEENAVALADSLVSIGLGPLVKAGDDIRNVMVNPTAGFDKNSVIKTVPIAEELSHQLQMNCSYQSLSPKFSFLLDGGESCAVLDHVNDIWLSATDNGTAFAFGVASCPPVNAHDLPAIGKVRSEHALDVVFALLDSLIATRNNNSAIERMKHWVNDCGREDILKSITTRLHSIEPAMDFRRSCALSHKDLGIHETAISGCFYLGIKTPFGRFTPQIMRDIADCWIGKTHKEPLHFTPWQSVLLPNCTIEEAQYFAQVFRQKGLITTSSDVFANIICCAGAPGCASGLANVQADAMKLAAELKATSFVPVHLTGCAKSCSATRAFNATLVAQAEGLYDLYFADKDASSKFGQLAARNIPVKTAATFLKSSSKTAC